MELMQLPRISAEEVLANVSMTRAIDALEDALRADIDPATAVPRSYVHGDKGELLVMPATGVGHIGVKLATVAPENPALGLPRIQGVYVLFEQEHLAPIALLDGIAVTSLRTPAMTALAARHLAPVNATRMVVFGTGPQAEGHIEAMRCVRDIEHVTVVARDAAKTAAFCARFQDIPVVPGGARAVADADVIVCTTTARSPLFDGALVPDGAFVAAIGSHERDARETDSTLAARSFIVVEDVDTALREAGDVVIPFNEGVITREKIVGIRDLLTGHPHVPGHGPRFFKGTGMAWQDLVVAVAATNAWSAQRL